MQQYIGTKIIHATPEENGETGQPGYRVMYPDGYVSWSPKDTFEEAYRPVTGMNFGLAVEAVKKSEDMKVARTIWPADVYIFREGNGIKVCLPQADQLIDDWEPTQEDMMADDWFIAAMPEPNG